MDSNVSIFGREPAFYVGLVEAVLVMALSFNFLGLTADTIAVIMAVVTGLLGFYTAYVTRQTLLGVGTGLAKSLVALGVAFGLHVTENQQAAIIALAVFILGAYQRTQATPVPKPEHNLNFAA